MKIVLLIDAWDPIIGGGQKLFWQIASGLVKDHSCQVEIITRSLKDKQGKRYDKNQTLLKGKLKIIRLGPCLSWSNLFGRLWFIYISALYAVKLNCDVYLASTFLPAISLQLIKLINKTPNALVAIGFGASNPVFKFLEKLITQIFSYDLLITDDFEFFTQIKNKRVTKFIPNGVILPKKQKLKKYSNFTFLFIGRNEPRKGIPILKQAFKTVKQQFPQVKLKIIGPGFKLVSQQQLEQELFKSHCLVLPSLQEGHPLILFEAWAHKLPVIATDVGSVSQFLNQSNGYLIPSNNSTKLAQAMVKAIKNKQLEGLGENGYQLVSQNYSWTKTTANYYQALSFLLQ